MLDEAEKNHHAQRRAMQQAMQEENLLLAKQKKDAELKYKHDALGYENGEVGFIGTN